MFGLRFRRRTAPAALPVLVPEPPTAAAPAAPEPVLPAGFASLVSALTCPDCQQLMGLGISHYCRSSS